MRLFAAVACAFVLVLAAACQQAPNPTESAEQALREANLTQVQVEWDGDARIAHLKGTVETSQDRERAGDVASSAVGTSGRVLNELTVKGLNEETADDLDGQIRSALSRMIDNDQVLRERDIDLQVTNGVVTIKGDVRTAAEKTKVTELVRAAPGVKDFANALEIKAER